MATWKEAAEHYEQEAKLWRERAERLEAVARKLLEAGDWLLAAERNDEDDIDNWLRFGAWLNEIRPMLAPAPTEEESALNDAMFEAVRLGYVEVAGTNENGQTLFRLTAAGTAYVEEMIRRGAKDA